MIMVWSSRHHYDEVFLTFSLFGHISLGKERCCDWVGEHKLIKLIDDSIDGRFSSESVEKGFFCCFDFNFN